MHNNTHKVQLADDNVISFPEIWSIKQRNIGQLNVWSDGGIG